MSPLDPPDRLDPAPSDQSVPTTRSRHRARHGESTPDARRTDEAAPEGGRRRYGDGLSAYPLYRDDTPEVEQYPGFAELAGDGESLAEKGEPGSDSDDTESRRAAHRREETDEASAPAAPEGNGRAGRNLPAAIAVGLALAVTAVAPLIFWKPAFLAVTAVAAGVATWELVRTVQTRGARPPLVPLLAGCPVMVGLAWYGGAEGLTLALVGTALAAMVWRLAEGPEGYQRDVGFGLLVAVYVPFLGSFLVLMLGAPHDGHLRVLATLAGVVLSDTGGYVAGVALGRHPMAPSVSPKKSWEGLVGSLLATGAGCALLLQYTMQLAWWYGAIFGLAVSAASVLGDLAESLLKRDLGVKDMSNLLPGHGGLMDRLDSLLFAAPTAYAVLALVTRAAG